MARNSLFVLVGIAIGSLACGDDGTGGSGASGGGPAGGSNAGGAAAGGTNQGGENPGGSAQGGEAQGGEAQGGQAQGGEAQGGQGGGTEASCDDLQVAIGNALQKAKECNPLIALNECTEIKKGLCCDVAVNPTNDEAIDEYDSLLDQFESQQCAADCPAIPCPDQTFGTCVGNQNPGQCQELAAG